MCKKDLAHRVALLETLDLRDALVRVNPEKGLDDMLDQLDGIVYLVHGSTQCRKDSLYRDARKRIASAVNKLDGARTQFDRLELGNYRKSLQCRFDTVDYLLSGLHAGMV